MKRLTTKLRQSKDTMKFLEKLLTVFVQLNRSQKLYFSSLYFIPFWAISLLLPFETLTRAFFYGFIALGLFGVISDTLIIYKKVWSSLLGKGTILVIYATLMNVAFALSSQAVNSIVEVEPSKLVYSISFVSILTIPLLISICSLFLFGGMILFGQIYFIISTISKDLRKITILKPLFKSETEIYPMRTMFIRFVYISVSLSTIVSFSNIMAPKYDKFVTNQASAFIYNFEAYSKSRCQLESGEKSILINDNEVVIAKKLPDGEYSFNLQACKNKVSLNKETG
jgi:hypothetical protein